MLEIATSMSHNLRLSMLNYIYTYIHQTALVLLGGCNLQLGRGDVFFDMPPRWQCRWRISVGVKARVVNWKQVDVGASRSLIAHCMQR